MTRDGWQGFHKGSPELRDGRGTSLFSPPPRLGYPAVSRWRYSLLGGGSIEAVKYRALIVDKNGEEREYRVSIALSSVLEASEDRQGVETRATGGGRNPLAAPSRPRGIAFTFRASGCRREERSRAATETSDRRCAPGLDRLPRSPAILSRAVLRDPRGRVSLVFRVRTRVRVAFVLHQVELPLSRGPLELRTSGTGTTGYQVVRRYNLSGRQVPPARDMLIEVEYDTEGIEVDDIVDVTVRLLYTGEKDATGMVIADVGNRIAFVAVQSTLEALVESGAVSRAEVAGRKVIFHFDSLARGVPVELTFRIRALYPVRAEGPSSRAYEYYDPEFQGYHNAGAVEVLPPVDSGTAFVRGDANRGTRVDLSDAVATRMRWQPWSAASRAAGRCAAQTPLTPTTTAGSKSRIRSTCSASSSVVDRGPRHPTRNRGRTRPRTRSRVRARCSRVRSVFAELVEFAGVGVERRVAGESEPALGVEVVE
jgi:hypothetical protein